MIGPHRAPLLASVTWSDQVECRTQPFIHTTHPPPACGIVYQKVIGQIFCVLRSRIAITASRDATLAINTSSVYSCCAPWFFSSCCWVSFFPPPRFSPLESPFNTSAYTHTQQAETHAEPETRLNGKRSHAVQNVVEITNNKHKKNKQEMNTNSSMFSIH